MSLLKKIFGGAGEISGPQTEAEGILGAVSRLFDKNEKEVAKLRPMVDAVNALSEQFKNLSDDEIKAKSAALKQKFKDEVTTRLGAFKDPASGEAYGWQDLDSQLSWSDDYTKTRLRIEKEVLDELLPEAFALTREAGDRTIGLRHFDVQLIGGAVLHSGRIGEMRTGEGKTLVATLPSYLNALTGRGVHVVTVNDYLAERDANWMRPIYEFLGLSVAFLQNDMDTTARQQVYNSDIVYGTNSEFGFDYLRDNMARSGDDLSQRPLNFAVIDEVDNILIDEARTPLIISAQVAKTDRALRRQEMAKTVNGVAKLLMPAVTDRDVEAFIDRHSTRGRVGVSGVDINGLVTDIFARGAFTEATDYLIDAYLLSEKTNRTDNAGRLLDVADELAGDKLIDDAGRADLEKAALAVVKPDNLRGLWRGEIEHLLKPFADAFLNAKDGDYNAELLAHDLTLTEEVALDFAQQIEAAADKEGLVALIIAEEMARRELIDPQSAERVADAVTQGQDALVLAVLEHSGPLADADAILRDNVAETAPTVETTRQIVGALELISERGLVPFESLEKLWGAVQLGQSPEKLRELLAKTIAAHPGDAAKQISELTTAYGAERQKFLGEQAAFLKTALPGHETVANRAGQGESAEGLRKLLQVELGKNGPFANAMKAANQFVQDQNRAFGGVADHLLEEMEQWVEVPQGAKKVIVSLLAEGGRAPQVQERVFGSVRDLPGDNSELNSLVADAVKQLQAWREENAAALVEKITGFLPLEQDGQNAIRVAIEDGEFSDGFPEFVGEQLLASPQIASLAEAIEGYGERWAEFKAKQSADLVESISQTHDISADARISLDELLAKPISGPLDAAIFAELAGDAVARHLEPLLTAENAGSFAEEVKRRIPLAKDISNKLKATEFAGKSAEQLSRTLQRLVVRSLEAMPFEDYKRVVKNLAWFAEKDERRRTAATTDMGTLIAEREAAKPVFTDPDNFLDALLQTEILTEEEGVIVQRAQAETPEESLSAIIDRTLRLPAERRRRFAEAKLQEVQPVLDQGIKAHALFEYNVNYVIGKDEHGKQGIVIVDEFTGRTMPGRRFSEGLHEALEAKHNLEVQLESQTVATITIQNYFRLYNKIAGMTGTAKTEETEFAKTYGVEVITIPTNRTIRRSDHPDVVYKTAEAKIRAITFDVLEHHCVGQPVLMGTRSVEMSERMSERLRAQSLQTLVLAHLIKTRLWDDKNFPQDRKEQVLAAVRTPLHELNPVAVKQIAKELGLNPEVTADENVDKLMSLFTMPNTDRTRLVTALKQGLAHNVLNAKNHRNEARIIAEAARPGAVTIATNMAGRGVDIMLGGSLDTESRWRVLTQQILARTIEGKPVHVRSRNQEATDKLLARLTPDNLQQLAWAVTATAKVDELERTRVIEGQAVKDLRDALGGELTDKDMRNRLRTRAKRYNLAEKLPIETPFTAPEVLNALSANLNRLMGQKYDAAALQKTLESGIQAGASGRDQGELAVLYTVARPLAFSLQASDALMTALGEVQDLDRALLELVVAGDTKPESLAANLEVVTPQWVVQRLQELNVPNSDAARDRLNDLPKDEIAVNEFQLMRMLGEANMGVQWLRERLGGWGVVKDAVAFEAPPELAQMIGDANLVHLRLDKPALGKLRAKWSLPARRRELVSVEAPNLVLLQELAGVVGPDAPILEPEWLHNMLTHLGLLADGDVMQAQMVGQVQDEQGNVSEQPLDVLVYRFRLPAFLEALKPTLQDAIQKVGDDPQRVFASLEQTAPYAGHFVDEEFFKTVAASEPAEKPVNAGTLVQIETGVAGQAADIVLETEARPEEIAHSSDSEEVKELGGLHIIGSERHESRRIDNQLRGRAGRQGDPGTSRFYVSLEDELWRLFGVRGQYFLSKWDEDEPVEAKMITASIARAQKKVELNHFESRKHVLQYDDVMNVQREVIYRERRRALLGDNVRDTTLNMAQRAAIAEAEKHCPRDVRPDEWDSHKLYLGLGKIFGLALVQKHLRDEDLRDAHWTERPGSSIEAREYDLSFHDNRTLYEVVERLYEEREESVGEENLRGLERWQVMRSIDDHWMEHLAEMDYLRDAIWQQGYAQKEPIGVYRQEGFALFQKMLGEIRREVTESLFSHQFGYELPQLEGLDLGNLIEARLLETLPTDDGIDDGTMLEKDADGREEVELVARQSASAPRNAGTTVAAPPQRPQLPQQPSNRAERRAAKKKR